MIPDMTLAALSLAAVLVAPQASPITADQLSWMSGYWLSCDGGREVSETWSDPRGGILIGSALTLEGGKLTGFESSRISPRTSGGEDLAYFAGVDGAPLVAFALKQAGATRVVFENPGHDFPQRVIYERQGDVLNARIEGRMGEREQAMAWSYHKAELNSRCPT
ncbi:MAG: hypothetical protein JWR59_1374 [Brevundimonas sp.]|nr:hypothetical protein [Brevundimonas sp.]